MQKDITLFIMTKKGYEVLLFLAEKFIDVISAVVSAKDLNIENDYYDEIRLYCEKSEIPFYDRHDKFKVTSKYSIAISWRWLIQNSPSKLIVFHDSLLPKYRGFNPLVSALINGEKQIGVTALYASNNYDRGDIIAQSATDISYPIKIQDAINVVIENYCQLSQKIVQTIVTDKTIKGEKQNEADATYSLWRDDDDYKVDWSNSSIYIKRFIDSVGYPYKGASTIVNGKSARIIEAEIVKDVNIENRTIGKTIFTIDYKPVVVCGTGLLKIDTLVDNTMKKSLLPLSTFRSRFK